MKTTLEMALEAGVAFDSEEYPEIWSTYMNVGRKEIEALADLVRADERNSWPAEMEAMERQVNILTDALNDRQRWFDAMTVQHKRDVHYWQDQTLNARADEREAVEELLKEYDMVNSTFAKDFRARSST